MNQRIRLGSFKLRQQLIAMSIEITVQELNECQEQYHVHKNHFCITEVQCSESKSKLNRKTNITQQQDENIINSFIN